MIPKIDTALIALDLFAHGSKLFAHEQHLLDGGAVAQQHKQLLLLGSGRGKARSDVVVVHGDLVALEAAAVRFAQAGQALHQRLQLFRRHLERRRGIAVAVSVGALIGIRHISAKLRAGLLRRHKRVRRRIRRDGQIGRVDNFLSIGACLPCAGVVQRRGRGGSRPLVGHGIGQKIAVVALHRHHIGCGGAV